VAWDVHKGAATFLEALDDVSVEPRSQVTLSSREELDALALRMRVADPLLLLLDYDGTLVPFAKTPDLAAPDRPLLELLAALAAKPGVSVHVVSGRRRETLERWLGALPIGLHAEHGYWSRTGPERTWTAADDVSLAWVPRARAILDAVTAVTPGALLEAKTACLAWHWRMAEPEVGAERAEALARRLQEATEGEAVRLLKGDKVLEICARGVGKGRVVERLLRDGSHPLPMAVAMGDDVTDDDLFRALPPGGISISVGFRPSAARYRVDHPRAARALLQRLLAPRA